MILNTSTIFNPLKYSFKLSYNWFCFEMIFIYFLTFCCCFFLADSNENRPQPLCQRISGQRIEVYIKYFMIFTIKFWQYKQLQLIDICNIKPKHRWKIINSTRYNICLFYFIENHTSEIASLKNHLILKIGTIDKENMK